MKQLFSIIVFIFLALRVSGQGNILYQTGITAEQNLNAIGKLEPYSTGGVGFDTRYQGVKGSPMMFDTLLTSLINVSGTDYFIELKADLNLIRNSVIFRHPKTGKLLMIPSDIVNEIKIDSGGKMMIFRISRDKCFDKDIKPGRFYQVLKQGKFQFIRIPIKKLIPADYKDVYSSDTRYDEYTTHYRYFIMNTDSTFNQVQLTKKSLVKLFPAKKDLIESIARSENFVNKEEMVISILDKF
jgi:hypothetical protein